VYAKEHLPVELTCQWEFIENVIGIKWLFNDREVLTLLARDGDFEHNRTTCRGSYSYIIPEFNSSYVGNYTCQVYTWIDPRVPFSGRYTVLLESPTDTTSVMVSDQLIGGNAVPSIVVPAIVATVTVAMVIIVVMVLVVVCVRYKMRVILREDYEAMSQPGRDGFRYDLFISYRDSDKMLSFVLDEVKAPLEAAGYRVCHHKEDFIAGMEIAENITKCLDDSRMVLVILTRDFSDSRWSMFELNYTINMVYEQRTRRLVPAAWSQKDLPHQLKNITFLKIENKEGSVFAERLQETLGDPIPN
jgi:hypothetical protein